MSPAHKEIPSIAKITKNTIENKRTSLNPFIEDIIVDTSNFICGNDLKFLRGLNNRNVLKNV